MSRVDDCSIPTGTAQAVVTGAQHSERAGFRQDMFVSEVEGTRTEDHRALRRRVRLSFDLSVCVVVTVVLGFEFCWWDPTEFTTPFAVNRSVQRPVLFWSVTTPSAQGIKPAHDRVSFSRPPTLRRALRSTARSSGWVSSTFEARRHLPYREQRWRPR